MHPELLSVIPVVPSAEIDRDIKWYKEKTGFEAIYADKMYAVLRRDNLCIHLQWHADTESDPLLGGSVIRIMVKDIKSIYEEFVNRGVTISGKLTISTPWGTNEFGFFDLNRNAIFIVEDV
jgi:hypothetical protein